MKRRIFCSLVGMLLVGATGAWAGQTDFVAAVLGALKAQGYDDIAVERTLLNRERIVARSSTLRREIVLDPRTGEILRDYWQSVDDHVPNRGSDGILSADEGAPPQEEEKPARDGDGEDQTEAGEDAP